MPVLHSPSRQQLAAYSPLTGGAVSRALRRSGASSEDTVRRLRSLLAQRYDADDVVLTDSGTSALQLAIRIAAARCGSAAALVALPAFTCFEVASAAVGAEVPVLLYDVVPETLAPDLASLERALVAGARVVVLSPLFGIPFDWDEITTQLARHGAIAIEDAAQGHGGSWRDRSLGSLGPLSVISFGRGKGWTASGGGALLIRHEPADSRPTLRIVSEHMAPSRRAASRVVSAIAQWTLGRPSIYGLPAAIPALGLGRTVYHPPRVPAAMDRFTAALLVETLHAASREAVTRREIAHRWRMGIRPGARISHVAVPASGEAGYLRFPLRITHANQRLPAHESARRLGVATTYPTTLEELAPLRARLVRPSTPSSFPGAVTLARDLITLPTHSLVPADGAEEVLDVVSELAGSA